MYKTILAIRSAQQCCGTVAAVNGRSTTMMLSVFRVGQRSSRRLLLLVSFLLAITIRHDPNAIRGTAAASAAAMNVAMVPKFDGLVVFEQARAGAYEAYRELIGESHHHHQSSSRLEYVVPPKAEGSGNKQIEIIQSSIQTGFDVILLSNNAADDIAVATIPATRAGLDIITFDSPIPSGVQGGEQLFVSQVDFTKLGQTMADMALQILTPNHDDDDNGDADDGDGQFFAILSASRRAANQNTWNDAMLSSMAADPGRFGNIHLLEIVYGDDSDSVSYEKANYLMDTYPEQLGLIMSPTTIGILAAARAVNDRGKCASIKVSGLGLPVEMLDYTLNGCAPAFALWDFVDLGYLTYYTAFRLETGAFKVEPGASFNAGRMGTFTVERDTSRPDVEAYRVIMGDFTIFNMDNIKGAVVYAGREEGGQKNFEQRFIDEFKRKQIAIIPKITGMISFVFSAYIVYSVLGDSRQRRSTKMRLLVGISIHDMIAAFFGFFLSTWPIPADTWLVYGNIGTRQTCTMQGFFFQAGISATPLYSAALTTFYLLNVVFKLRTETIVNKAEPFLHGIPIAFGWGTAIAGLPLSLYNSADRIGFMCWIAEYPAYCSLRDNCQRGEKADIYRWLFLYAWVFAVFVYMAVCMAWIYYVVLTGERATDRWTAATQQRRRRNLSHKVAASGVQYVFAFIFPWIFGITVSIMQSHIYGDISATTRLGDTITALEIVNAVVWPLKGFFTFLAYMRPSKKRSTRHTSSTGAVSSSGEDLAFSQSRGFIVSFLGLRIGSRLSREQHNGATGSSALPATATKTADEAIFVSETPD